MIRDEDVPYSTTGKDVLGYEIHMGRTWNLGRCQETIRLEDGRADGLGNAVGTVFGTYLHGIFDSGDLASLVVNRLRSGKGWNPGTGILIRKPISSRNTTSWRTLYAGPWIWKKSMGLFLEVNDVRKN